MTDGCWYSHAHSNYFPAAYHCYNISFNVIAVCLSAVMTSSGIGYCLAICKCTQKFHEFYTTFWNKTFDRNWCSFDISCYAYSLIVYSATD